MDYVLFKLKFKNKLNYWQIIAEDWKGYFRHIKTEYGLLLLVYCGASANLAADLGAMVFKEVYKLDSDFDMKIEFGSWKKFWV